MTDKLDDLFGDPDPSGNWVEPFIDDNQQTRRSYDNFLDRLKQERGYDVVERMKSSTHPIYIIKRGDTKYFLKFNWDHCLYIDGLKAEERMLGRLSGVPGIVEMIDSGEFTVDADGQWCDEKEMPIFYIVKEYLPGGPLHKVEKITPEMVGQLLETADALLSRNIFLQRDIDLTDFVLDERGRPVLVDLEHPGYGGKSKFRNRLRAIGQRYRMLRALEGQTAGCTDQYPLLRIEDVKDLALHSVKILASGALIAGALGLGIDGMLGNRDGPPTTRDLIHYLEIGGAFLSLVTGMAGLAHIFQEE